MDALFRLSSVSVLFERHAIERRSLKYRLRALYQEGRNGDRFAALSDVSLVIREGEHIGVIGRNGAGKSTLLRVLAGVIAPQRGLVSVDRSKHIVPLLELGIGFQPDLSGRENCFLAGLLLGYTRAEIEARIDGIRNFAELGDFFDEPVKEYSSGMFARLAFALATDVEPEVLLVDEVFGVGDEFFMRRCVARMQRLMRQGKTTVFVSHNVDFLVAQCSRLIWLDQGRVAGDGEPKEVADAYRRAQGVS